VCCTGVGGDTGTVQGKNWLRFPYVFIFVRSHDLSPPAPVSVACERLSTGLCECVWRGFLSRALDEGRPRQPLSVHLAETSLQEVRY
jgi:hypothetical protein